MPSFRATRPLGWGISLLVLFTAGCATSGGEKKVVHPIPRLYGAADPQFSRTMGSFLGPGIVDGNRVDLLQNGDEIFPAMLEAIRRAEKTITFETFIYWSGSIGNEFAFALAERARAGVKVHVLLDWIGTNKMDAALLAQMLPHLIDDIALQVRVSTVGIFGNINSEQWLRAIAAREGDICLTLLLRQ